MRKSAVWIVVLCVALAVPAFVLSGDKQTSDEKIGSNADEATPKNDAAKSTGPVTDDSARKDSSRDSFNEKPLGFTVKLVFSITNDDGKHSFPVACAARSFLIEHDITEADGGNQIKFAGTVSRTDAKGRIFVSFDVLHFHSNLKDDFEATLKLKGSVVTQSGKLIELGSVGDQKVSLTATIIK